MLVCVFLPRPPHPLAAAWDWLAGNKGTPYGVVSGGAYEDYTWCSSYSLKPCNHYESPNNTLPSCEEGAAATTPACPTACDAESEWATPFAKDVTQFSSVRSRAISSLSTNRSGGLPLSRACLTPAIRRSLSRVNFDVCVCLCL